MSLFMQIEAFAFFVGSVILCVCSAFLAVSNNELSKRIEFFLLGGISFIFALFMKQVMDMAVLHGLVN